MAKVHSTFSLEKNSVQLTEDQWDQIALQIAEYGIASLKDKVLNQAIAALKTQAAIYLNIYNANLQILTNLKNLLLEQKKMRDQVRQDQVIDTIMYEKNMASIREILDTVGPQLYNSLYVFQDMVNNFLGQEAKTIIVYKGELYEVIDNYANLMKYDYNKTSLVARWNITENNLEQSLRRLSLKEYDKTQLNRVEYGRNSALWRFNYSRKKRPHMVALVLWRQPKNRQKWNGMTVSARGDIEESYAAIILNHKENLFLSDTIEDILEIFMRDFVGKVNNISGMLEGDIQAENSNIEYAIKSADASALGFKQFVTLAKMILRDDFSYDKLEQYKQKLHDKGAKTTRNKFYEDINNEIYDDIWQAMEEGLIDLTN